MSETLALIIDDEPDIRQLLNMALRRIDIDCVCVGDMRAARRALETQEFALCLTDMRLPDGDGLDLVKHCQECYPQLPIAVLTAHGSMESAIQALKLGAFDFLSKPVDISLLRTVVGNALRVNRATAQDDLRLIGDSLVMRALRDTIGKLARSQAPVHIHGESGTGKELVARMIHARGPRAEQPFVPVNCAAIPGELLESEFFGHVKGSFTGAVRDNPGLFRVADGGTLFLDEVAELPQHMQVKLLRAIQEKAVRPVGGKGENSVDVRLLSATNQDLLHLVEQGRFRQDLYYRVNVLVLDVPPLRARRDDIPLLTAHILSGIVGAGGGCGLSDAAMECLRSHDWPGNIRELENVLERAVALSGGADIDVDALQLLQRGAAPDPVQQAEGDTTDQGGDGSGKLEQLLSNVERKRILEALEKTRWNRTQAAQLLGLSLRALRYRLKKLGLERGSR